MQIKMFLSIHKLLLELIFLITYLSHLHHIKYPLGISQLFLIYHLLKFCLDLNYLLCYYH